MADTEPHEAVAREVPDPRYRQFPTPDTVDEVIERIVEFVQISVTDAGGPAYEFEKNGAEATFKARWGHHVAKHLKYNKYSENPWPHEWMNVVEVAKMHGALAVDRARKSGHKPVSMKDFEQAGIDAAGYCANKFGPRLLGCWCNDC